MSNRSLLELNHDCCPRDNEAELLEWARSLMIYMSSGDHEYLPDGVKFMGFRHHSEPEFQVTNSAGEPVVFRGADPPGSKERA